MRSSAILVKPGTPPFLVISFEGFSYEVFGYTGETKSYISSIFRDKVSVMRSSAILVKPPSRQKVCRRLRSFSYEVFGYTGETLCAFCALISEMRFQL